MQTIIGPYDPATRQVRVTFETAVVTHTRQVNACHDDTDAYDPAATADRIADVARGVEIKIALGVIVNPAPAANPESAVED